MNKRQKIDTPNKLAVDLNELRAMLSLGRNNAAELGEKAGAVIRVGRRKLYNVKKIERYINTISEVK